MKTIFLLSMLVPFAMICSCQKQDSAAERQLAQRMELDAREKALDEREKALAEREKATNIQTVPDPAQVNAERDKRLQQLPPDVQSPIPDRSQLQAETESGIQEQLSERQRRLEELQRIRMSAAAARPATATSPSSSGAPK